MPTLGDTMQQHANQPVYGGAATANRGGGRKIRLADILGIIGDGLAVWGGGRASYGPAIREDRLLRDQLQQRYDLAEYQNNLERANKKWEWANKPETPTEMQRNYEWLLGTDPEAAKNYKSRQTNDTLWRQGPDGRFYPFDPTPSVPDKPVGTLTPIPETSVPSGNPLSPNLQAIYEDARRRGQNYMTGGY